MAQSPVIGIERVWHSLMMLLGKTLNNRASANKIIVRALRSQQVKR